MNILSMDISSPLRKKLFLRSFVWTNALAFGFLLGCTGLSKPTTGDDWLQWRGPNGNGTAATQQQPPTTWSESENIVWRTAVPGRGHSSPTLVKGMIYLTTADVEKQTQSVLCFDRSTGRMLWSKVIHQGKFVKKIHSKNTHASPTIASDGKSLFVLFNHDRSVFLTRLSLSGVVEWQKKTGDFFPFYPFGYGASPILFQDKVLVAAEGQKVGFLAAFDKETGDEHWRQSRPNTSYSSPIVAEVGNRKQVLLSGQSSVAGYDPESGKQIWKAPTRWQVSCGTLVWSQDHVFASGGFPRAQTLCVKADGSGKVVWQNNVKCYEQSMLYHDGFLYGISDSGIGYCWDAEKGTEKWKARMEGSVSCSPILVNGNIYYSSEKGTTFVFKASPSRFELISKNKLGDSAFATPAYCDNRIYTRIAKYEGSGKNEKRQEYLICIGQ